MLICKPARSFYRRNEIQADGRRALLQQLKERVLGIRPRFAPDDRAGRVIDGRSREALLDHEILVENGRIVEAGLTDQILEDPQHEYTQLLVNSVL